MTPERICYIVASVVGLALVAFVAFVTYVPANNECTELFNTGGSSFEPCPVGFEHGDTIKWDIKKGSYSKVS